MSQLKIALSVLRDKDMSKSPELLSAAMDVLEGIDNDLNVGEYEPSSKTEPLIDTLTELINSYEAGELNGVNDLVVNDEEEDEIDNEFVDDDTEDEDDIDSNDVDDEEED